MVIVTAKISAKAGSEKELEAVFRDMVEKVAAEEGTLAYSLHRSRDDAGRFMFYEKYQDAEALKRHSSTSHFKAMSQAIRPLVAAPPEIEIYEELAKID